MKPAEVPSSQIYIAPKDFPANKMHYCVVQVSPHRHAVAVYTETTCDPENLPCFSIITKPMIFEEASDLAWNLTMERNNENR